MTPADPPEITEVLDTVRSWPASMRVTLARRILELAESADATPPKTRTMDQVLGLLRPSGPPPSDEECRRIIEEERMRTYG